MHLLAPGRHHYWVIQHQGPTAKDKKWCFSNFDTIARSVYHESYDTWDSLGVQGFSTLGKARKALEIVKAANKDTNYVFRLVKIQYTLKITPEK